MKKRLTPTLLVLTAILLFISANSFAQDPRRDNVRQLEQTEPDRPAGGRRPNLLQELGLSAEQIQAVRRINQQRKPIEQEARWRFQEAQRALNIAIYGDSVSESGVQARLKEFQAAQAELARIKFTNELAIRKLLTPEQLVKFRELRRRFAEERGNVRRSAPGERPLRRLRRGKFPPVN